MMMDDSAMPPSKKDNPEKYERSNKKEGGAKAKAPTDEKDM